MSLLNDALRKKNKEIKQPGMVNLFQQVRAGGRGTRGKKRVFIALVLMVCIVVIGLSWQWFFQPVGTSTKPQMSGDRIPVTDGESPVFKDERPPVSPAPSDEGMVSPDPEGDNPISSNGAGPGPEVAADKTEEQDLPVINDRSDDRVIPEQKVGLKSATSFYLKAVSYHRRNEFKKAIRMYQEVLRKDPEHYDALFNLAAAYLSISSFSDAYVILKRLEESDPKNPQILLNLAIAEIGLERPYNAISYLDDADALNNSPQFEILFHRGVALSKLDMLNEAETWYKKAEELDPDHPRLLFNLAVVYDRLQMWHEALKYYGAFLRNKEGSSGPEREEIENRVKDIKVYMGSPE